MWQFKLSIKVGKVKEIPIEDVQLDALVERSDPNEVIGFAPPQRAATLPTTYDERQY